MMDGSASRGTDRRGGYVAAAQVPSNSLWRWRAPPKGRGVRCQRIRSGGLHVLGEAAAWRPSRFHGSRRGVRQRQRLSVRRTGLGASMGKG